MKTTTNGSKSPDPGIMVENSKPGIFDKLYFCFFSLLPLIYYDKLIDPVLLPRQIFLTFFVSGISLVILSHIKQKKLFSDFSFLRLGVFVFLLSFIIISIISFHRSNTVSESFYILSKILIEFNFFMITTLLIIQNQLGSV